MIARIEVPLTIADVQSARASQLARGNLERDVLAREFAFDQQAAAAMKEKFAAVSDLSFATQRLARVSELHTKQLALAKDLEEAEADVARAELDLTSAEDSLASIESARAAYDRSKDRAPSHAVEIDTGYPLRTPIAGEIAAMEVALGQAVAQHQVVCEIINPDSIWLSAYVPEHDLAALLDMSSAHVRLSAYPDRLFDLEADLGGKLAYKARVLNPETRTATVRYELQNPDGILRGGMFADVLLASGAVENAVAIPESAVVQQDGLSVAYVMLDGEHFEKRVLQTGIRDGGMIEVKSGLQAGERVVTRGAYLVRLAASAPDSFGHGHVH